VVLVGGCAGQAAVTTSGTPPAPPTPTPHVPLTARVIPSANPYSEHDELSAIAAVSATDAWAFGYGVDKRAGSTSVQALALRWDVSSWKSVAGIVPSSFASSYLIGATAVSASDVWAVGSYLSFSTGPGCLIEHWNGTKWQIVATPRAIGGQLRAIA